MGMAARETISGAVGDVRGAADSRPVGWLGRAGLTARGLVYILIGVLALLVAHGGDEEVDQKGALEQVLSRPYGGVLVAALAVGFAAYALWRVAEAMSRTPDDGDSVGVRIQSLLRAVVYAALAVSSVGLLLGSRSSQSGQQQELTARVMHHPGGRVLIGAIGLTVAVVGLVLAWEGLSQRFMRYFPAGALTPRRRATIRTLGVIGNVARGLVFALIGVLVVVAAVRFEPSKAGGLDSALKTLRDRSYGPFILAVMAAGLIAFGAYGLLEARFRRV
jgi:Domain of Unknown Function (DUF1206)